MKNTYRILNRITNQWWQGQAQSAQQACQQAAWPIGDCHVKQYVEPHPDPTKDSGNHYGGWKKAP